MNDLKNLIDVNEECALCGAIIFDPSQAHKVSPLVEEQDFSDRGIGRMFSLLVNMVEAKENPKDARLLVARLKEAKLFEEVGGVAGLSRMSAACGSPASAPTYAKRIKKLSLCRQIVLIASEAYRDAQAPDADPIKISSNAQTKLQGTMSVDDKDMLTVYEGFENAIATAKEDQKTSRVRFIRTGFEGIDRIAGGLKCGDYAVLGARPSVGKTAFATQIACNAALSGKRVLFVSLEMYISDIIWRIAASYGIAENRNLRSGNMTEDDWQTVTAHAEAWREVPLTFWSPRKMPRASEIAARARVMHMTTGIDLIVLDYLQLIAPDYGITKRHEQVAKISVDMKAIVKELGCASLLLAQLGRDAEGQKPQLKHLKESGGLEENADNVWLLYRERGSADALVILAKQRGAPVGEVSLKYDAEKTRFEDDVAYA